MVEAQILQDQRSPELGICRHRKKEDGTTREVILLTESDTPIKRGGFKAEMQQRVNERKLRLSKRLRAYVRRPRMANEMHG
jgi:hypothetical protein